MLCRVSARRSATLFVNDPDLRLYAVIITLTKVVQESNVVGLGLGNGQLTAVCKESRHENWSAVLFFGSLLVWRSWGVVKLDNKTQKNKVDMSSWGREASLHARTLLTDYDTLCSYVLPSTFMFWSYSGLWLAGMKLGHYPGEFVRSEPDPRNFSPPHKSPDNHNPILFSSAIRLNCGVENIWVTTVRRCSSRG